MTDLFVPCAVTAQGTGALCAPDTGHCGTRGLASRVQRLARRARYRVVRCVFGSGCGDTELSSVEPKSSSHASCHPTAWPCHRQMPSAALYVIVITADMSENYARVE